MRRFTFLAICAAAATLGASATAAPAADLLRYVPQDAEVVIGIDVQALTAQPAFEKVYDRLDTSKFEAGINALYDITGVHLMQDIEALMFVGELRDEGQGAIVIRGNWNRAGLEDLVSWNPTYQTEEQGGKTMHIWWDENESKQQHAVFVEDNVLVMSESASQVWYVVEAALDPAKSLKKAHPEVTAPEDAHAFLIAFRPENDTHELVRNPLLGRLENVNLRLVAEETGVRAELEAAAMNPADAPHLARILEGFVAFCEMHDEQGANSPWSISSKVSAKQVHAQIRIPLENVVAGAPRLQQLAKAE